MTPSENHATALALYPEDTREAVALLKQALPLMVRHNIPPNPVHYALWYTYSKGQEPELNFRLDRLLNYFDCFPPESAEKLFASTSSAMNWRARESASSKRSI